VPEAVAVEVREHAARRATVRSYGALYCDGVSHCAHTPKAPGPMWRGGWLDAIARWMSAGLDWSQSNAELLSVERVEFDSERLNRHLASLDFCSGVSVDLNVVD
jgi:hypothetical protein